MLPQSRRGRAAMPASKSEGAAPQVQIKPAEEETRLRAYQKYLERNGAAGDPVLDWLAAEEELRRSKCSGPMAPRVQLTGGKRTETSGTSQREFRVPSLIGGDAECYRPRLDSRDSM